MKKIKLCLILSGLLLLSGCGKADVKPAAPEPPTAVSVQNAKKGNIVNSDSFSGRTQAGAEIAVSAEMAGTVEKVYVVSGQKVQKGDKLLTIKGSDASKSVDQARAALELARASFNSATGGSVSSQMNQLENAVTSAQLTFDEAQRNYDIYKQLYDSNAIAEDQFKKIELSLTQATQQLNTAKKAYETAKNQTIPDSQHLARKQLDQAEISYQNAASNLNKLTLTAPADGIVTTINFNDNELISQSMPAFIISNINRLESDLQVTEVDVNKFKAGDTVAVTIGGKELAGKVKDVSRVTNSKTSLFTVKIALDNSQYHFPAGMAIDVKLTTQKSENVVTIPKKALIEDEGKHYVYLCQDNKAVKTAVETGLSDAYRIEIKQGVKEGDTVVIGGISLIKDGDDLFPVEKED